MTMTPWDQQVARRVVKPLARTPVRPNHITTLTLLLAVAGAGMLSFGTTASAAPEAMGYANIRVRPGRMEAVEEHVAALWIYLAISGGYGRDIAFSLVRRRHG